MDATSRLRTFHQSWNITMPEGDLESFRNRISQVAGELKLGIGRVAAL